jgi:hypothetical protein
MENFNRIFFIFWVFAFMLFAYWQFNDPDPHIWVPVYMVAALYCGMALRGIHPLVPLGIVIIACVIGAFYFYPESVSDWVNHELEQKDLSMKTQASEEARETFGLLIIAAVLTYSFVLGWKKKNA